MLGSLRGEIPCASCLAFLMSAKHFFDSNPELFPRGSCFLRLCQVLVFINRHNPTIYLVEEKQRGLIPLGLQSWPLQLIEHLANTTSVAPPPAGPAGCRPLYLLHLLNLVLQYGLQIGAAYSSLGRTKVLYATSLVLLGAKAKFLLRKHEVLVALDEISEICRLNPCSL